MQPFINPNYFSYPMQQPYIPQHINGIAGKYVNDFSEITANDVAMDGKPSVFIKNTRDEIQIREWSPNGQILSTSYKAISDNNPLKANNLPSSTNKSEFDAKSDVLEPIFARLDSLEKKIDKIYKPTGSKTRKEVVEDE